MGKIKKLELTPEQYADLENGFRNGESHCFRMRCRAVLLKGKGLSSAKAGEQTEMSFVSVNAWGKRFLSEGIEGLKTRPGRRRKPIMDSSDYFNRHESKGIIKGKKMISLIAFLGNVGREYERTRHNAAWIAVDHLNICKGISWQHKFRGLYGRFPAAVSGGQAVHALKPETYMNLSGEAVGEAAQFFKIPPAEILIVHDELELPPAALSLKWSGGLGGHNGLRSIKAALGTPDFWRLRIGIGRPGGKKSSSADHPDIAGYVLSPFSQEEFTLLDAALPQLEPLFTALITERQEPQTLLSAWTKVLPDTSV